MAVHCLHLFLESCGMPEAVKLLYEIMLTDFQPSEVILVGCAQTAAVLDESMIGGMGGRWDFIIGWLID